MLLEAGRMALAQSRRPARRHTCTARMATEHAHKIAAAVRGGACCGMTRREGNATATAVHRCVATRKSLISMLAALAPRRAAFSIRDACS